MQTGRFINKLENDVLTYYQTSGLENLLTPQNLKAVWNINEQGEYFQCFPDEMALALSSVTLAVDSGGRQIVNNDTVIVKFDFSDRETILGALKYSLLPRMKQVQNNGEELKNPLSEVKL
jgi:hypothetical protein